jgi:iron complex transport system permease protein
MSFLQTFSKYRTGILLIFLVLLIWADVFTGTSSDFKDLWHALTNYDSEQLDQLVLREFRIPRAVTACFAGAALSICGLLMQTMFNNPLAGPYVLGISSGSSLFVALGAMSGFHFFKSDPGNIVLAFGGSLVFGLIILGFARWIRSQVSLLLAGLMLGSVAGAMITALEATAAAQELRSYTLWTMGSLSNTTFDQIPLMMGVVLPSLLACVFMVKPLNALLLGEEHAALLGIRMVRFRTTAVILTSVLAGTVTAFCGPIAFVGLAVPNLVKLLFKSASHSKLLVGCALLGALFLVLTDLVIHWLEPYFLLPLNAFTTLIGAPVVLYLILKRWS